MEMEIYVIKNRTRSVIENEIPAKKLYDKKITPKIVYSIERRRGTDVFIFVPVITLE